MSIWTDRQVWIVTAVSFVISAAIFISQSDKIWGSLWSALLTAGLVFFSYMALRWLWLASR